MEAEEAPRSDRNAVQWLLRSGLALAVGLMTVGFLVRVLAGEPAAPAVSLRQVLSGDASRGDWLMGLGALVLGLTPGFRVLMLVVLWTRERDWRFALVAALVVVTLTVSLLLGVG